MQRLDLVDTDLNITGNTFLRKLEKFGHWLFNDNNLCLIFLGMIMALGLCLKKVLIFLVILKYLHEY